jgi:DNA-binding NarL/FixJ family response regulator
MTTSERQPSEPTNSRNDPERVVLIAADSCETARVLGELDSVTEERFQVEWVTELSGGIERLGDGGVGAAVVDLNLPGSQGTETFDKVAEAAPDVPVLILSESDTEATARQAVRDLT